MGLFELFYYVGYRVKTAVDLKDRRRLPKPVISVGNLTTGGTGKTPATIAIALQAQNRGLFKNPCVLTRGYRGKLKGPVVVDPGMSTAQAGDEPLLMAGKLGGIPVVKCANRYEGGLFALGNIEPVPDLFVLDDGFQHRRLLRDVDILLVNSHDPFGGGHLLPLGSLREPMSQIQRADVIVITKMGKGDDAGPLSRQIRKYNEQAPIFTAGFGPTHLVSPDGERLPTEWLRGKDVFGFCGIGEPESFKEVIVRAGAHLRGFRKFGDHYHFSHSDLQKVLNEAHVSGAPWLLSTEKDLVRLQDLEPPENLLALAIEFTADNTFFDEVFGRLS